MIPYDDATARLVGQTLGLSTMSITAVLTDERLSTRGWHATGSLSDTATTVIVRMQHTDVDGVVAHQSVLSEPRYRSVDDATAAYTSGKLDPREIVIVIDERARDCDTEDHNGDCMFVRSVMLGSGIIEAMLMRCPDLQLRTVILDGHYQAEQNYQTPGAAPLVRAPHYNTHTQSVLRNALRATETFTPCLTKLGVTTVQMHLPLDQTMKTLVINNNNNNNDDDDDDGADGWHTSIANSNSNSLIPLAAVPLLSTTVGAVMMSPMRRDSRVLAAIRCRVDQLLAKKYHDIVHNDGDDDDQAIKRYIHLRLAVIMEMFNKYIQERVRVEANASYVLRPRNAHDGEVYSITATDGRPSYVNNYFDWPFVVPPQRTMVVQLVVRFDIATRRYRLVVPDRRLSHLHNDPIAQRRRTSALLYASDEGGLMGASHPHAFNSSLFVYTPQVENATMLPVLHSGGANSHHPNARVEFSHDELFSNFDLLDDTADEYIAMPPPEQSAIDARNASPSIFMPKEFSPSAPIANMHSPQAIATTTTTTAATAHVWFALYYSTLGHRPGSLGADTQPREVQLLVSDPSHALWRNRMGMIRLFVHNEWCVDEQQQQHSPPSVCYTTQPRVYDFALAYDTALHAPRALCTPANMPLPPIFSRDQQA
jgi:hypothetical protein